MIRDFEFEGDDAFSDCIGEDEALGGEVEAKDLVGDSDVDRCDTLLGDKPNFKIKSRLSLEMGEGGWPKGAMLLRAK